jgi:hypothetical protein
MPLGTNMKKVQIVDTFDHSKNYGIHISPQSAKCLSVLKKGEKFVVNDFVRNHLNEFTDKVAAEHTNRCLVYKAFRIGKKIGIIEDAETQGITFDECVKLESVEYFLNHYSKSHYKNIRSDKHRFRGTQRAYGYALKRFNNWLIGKSLEYEKLIHTGNDNYKKVTKSVTLRGLEDLLKLVQESVGNKSQFIKIIKKYLNDSCHEGKSSSTMSSIYFAINGYFEKNEAPIHFKFSAKIKYNNQTEIESEQNLSLEDLLKMLTVGRPSLMQKAVYLCKFQRGLDSSTLADRFNFEVWKQLVEFFGTEKYHSWDLEKCPVPIKLVRIKTNFRHVGFLDVDSISAIQDYLDIREKKTHNSMQEGQALFLNTFQRPISEKWVHKGFFDLAQRAGVQQKIELEKSIKYEKDSHEVRDLLKSTLIACGTRYDVADHVIGHKPKDSYEKQTSLYAENLRNEYRKASKKINMFSNMSTYMKGDENSQILKEELTNQKRINQQNNERIQEIQGNITKIMSFMKD